MSFTYNGDHSIMLIKADNSVDYASLTESSIEDYYDTWDSLHLIPESRPLVNTPQPSISLYPDSATSKLIDLTDKVAGGQLFGPRQGEWTFIVDHDRWPSWHEARKTLEKILNGQKLYCILNDDPNTVYYGRFVLNGWNDGDQFSTVAIGYDLNYTKYANRFSSFLVTNVRMTLKSNAPVVYVGDPIAKISDYVDSNKTYMNGSTYTATVDSSLIERVYDGWFDRAGENVINVRYRDEIYPLSIMVDSVSLSYIETSIIDSTSPFIVGENKTSVLSRLIVYATYSDGSRKSVDSRHCNVDSGVFSTYGTIPVNVRYGNKSTTVNVEVAAVSRITCALDNSMEGRIVGDSTRSIANWLTITGVYTDQSTFSINSFSSDVTYSPDYFTEIGSKEVNIIYLNMYSANIFVQVYRVSSMEARLKSNSLRLLVGFNSNCISRWRYYSADLYYILSNGTRRDANGFSVSYDSTTIFSSSGNKTIHYSYGNDVSTDLTINVENVSITSITATTNEYFNRYVQHFRVGMIKQAVLNYFDFTIHYSDGQTQTVYIWEENNGSFDWVRGAKALFSFVDSQDYNSSFTSSGTYTIRLKYLDSYTFNINVQVES